MLIFALRGSLVLLDGIREVHYNALNSPIVVTRSGLCSKSIETMIRVMQRFFLFLLMICCSAMLYAEAPKLPIIGITGAHGSENSVLVSSAFVKSVLRAGGVPVVLPINDDLEVIKTMVASIDALIMTAGEDVEPSRYSEEPLPHLEQINPERDEFDIAIVKLAVQHGIPVLGICRGHQVMCVAFGGTLYQDIYAPVKAADLKHQQQAPDWHGTHQVHLEKDSVLAKILGKTTVMTNSFHHQAVKDVAPGFVITGRTSDGIVEAMEMKDNPRVFSVQFHPEIPTARGSDELLPIFTYLVGLAKRETAQ